MKLDRGILIAIEGIDGAGKTTQARALQQRLTTAGFDVVLTKEPTDGPWGRRLRESARTGRLSPDEELRYFLEDRREHVEQMLAPDLAAGCIVLVDRYYFSSVAYQGARGMDPQAILAANEAFAPVPDLLVVLDVPAEVGVARIRRRDSEENLFEAEEALARSREIFRGLAGSYLRILDGTLPADRLTDQILAELREGPLFERLCLVRGQKQRCEPATCPDRGRCPWIKTGVLVPAPDLGMYDLASRIANDPTIPVEQKAAELLAAINLPLSVPR